MHHQLQVLGRALSELYRLHRNRNRNAILGVPYYNCSIMGPQSPNLILVRPLYWLLGLSSELRGVGLQGIRDTASTTPIPAPTCLAQKGPKQGSSRILDCDSRLAIQSPKPKPQTLNPKQNLNPKLPQTPNPKPTVGRSQPQQNAIFGQASQQGPLIRTHG